MSEEPVLHGGFRNEGSQVVEYLNPSGSELVRVSHSGSGKSERRRPIKLSEDATQGLFTSEISWSEKVSGVRYDLGSRQSFSYIVNEREGALWSHRFLSPLAGVRFLKGSRNFVGWSHVPAALYFLVWGSGRLELKSVVHTYKWDPQSEIVDFRLCEKGRALLFEQLDDGLLRVVLFRADQIEGLQPVAYLHRAYSPKSLSSGRQELSGVRVSRDCSEVFLAGSFGIVRERYPWRP